MPLPERPLPDTGDDDASLPGLPVRFGISALVMAGMILLAVVLVSVGWWGARQVLLDMAERSAEDAGRIMTERSRRIIDPAVATLRQLAFDPITQAGTLDERLTRIAAFSIDMVANPLVSAVYVGYPNGDFLLVRALRGAEQREFFAAPAATAFLVQTITVNAAGQQKGQYRFYSAELKLLALEDQPAYRFDPRTRPWYASADRSLAPAISAPYVFFTTRQIGISLSQRARNSDAVVAIDMTLDDLAASLGNLRLTPHSELALVDENDKVIAYGDMGRVLEQDGDNFRFRSLAELDVSSLSLLSAKSRAGEQRALYDVNGREWLGLSLPFNVIDGHTLNLLIAAPGDELLGQLDRNRKTLVLVALLLVIAFLPLGWWAGRAIGRSMERLALQAGRMSRFDFRTQDRKRSALREVNMLTQMVDHVSLTVEAFLDISAILSTEIHVEEMLQQVLEKFVQATRCDGGAVYLWQRESRQMQRAAAYGQQCGLTDTMAYEEHGPAADMARETDDNRLRVELDLRGRNGSLEGLLVLMHAHDSAHEDPRFLAFARRLSGMLAVAIETRQLIAGQKALLESLIRLMADAIDAKSPYTGGHCERVPHLAIMLVESLEQERDGRYADFSLNEDQRYAFQLAALLHDCGKVTSPEHIVDKATKLEVIHNRIHEVRMRFEVLWRDAELELLHQYLPALAPAQAEALRLRLEERRKRLHEDFAFVAQCNVGGEAMSEQAIAQLRQIATQTWQRHFDDSLGLADEESRRLAAARGGQPAQALPQTEQLLADRPEHMVAWDEEHRPAVERDDPRNTLGFNMKLPRYRQNMGELHNLTVRRGTLTEEDRFAINNHIVQTLVMLKSLPWPDSLKSVPDTAANHHEKMDGTGYPRGLLAGELPLQDRVMALADVFEALTAADRPYKPAKTLSESLRIMAFMCRDRHLDADLFRYFLRSRLWQNYADDMLRPAQRDEVDIAGIEALLAPPPA
ncbi:HD domain-containing phosphohydrolase [Herbaspirillum frisingense]|uniref:HD domain-containing phosphohydrolase n=1 Tax=Herbaspirillum frisingense TaxID=92645 RepID=UPI001F367F6C|nr:HD domain-containing phosphohydrolase [Herbaspirillum frisingense]UIN21984.1 metal-dependent phosphohydrolase [Herbaspirillum frisingense]